ncbi:MAG: hypothetical protein K9G59_11300 [Caulobacter sp.]|nr:hypothetical protein [Caulobacter sp.]
MISRRLVSAMALGALILGVAAALRYAEGAGMLDADSARRTMQVLIGLGLAAYANLMPKQMSGASASPLAVARTQSALRFGGWSLTLAGLVYAGLWAFAPLAFADNASMIVVAAATLLTLGYTVWTVVSCRAAPRPPAV